MTSFSHALVTGGGSGIGKAVAEALATSGVKVTICGRRRELLEDVARANNIFAQVADITNKESVAELYRHAQSDRGPFDIVIANAGQSKSAPFSAVTFDDWQQQIDVNLTGAFLTVQPAISAMQTNGRGRIIFIASTAGLKPYSYVAAYVAAKHGVIGLMRSLAQEYAATGITVNAICPGFVETEMLSQSLERIQKKTGRSKQEARALLMANNPQGRFIQTKEVADAVLWLCSDNAASIAGQAISISGGETY